jgi:hypothetical protein
VSAHTSVSPTHAGFTASSGAFSKNLATYRKQPVRLYDWLVAGGRITGSHPQQPPAPKFAPALPTTLGKKAYLRTMGSLRGRGELHSERADASSGQHLLTLLSEVYIDGESITLRGKPGFLPSFVPLHD